MTSRRNRDVKTEYQNIVRMEYQMNSGYFYAMLSRMKYINRWGLMRNTKNENLSEHSLETAFIAHALGIINNEVFHGIGAAMKQKLFFLPIDIQTFPVTALSIRENFLAPVSRIVTFAAFELVTNDQTTIIATLAI